MFIGVIAARLAGIFAAFLATYCGYYFFKYVYSLATGNPDLPFSSAALATLIFGAMLSGLATLYAIPFAPFLGKLIQRDFPYLKPWYLTVVAYVFGLSLYVPLNALIPLFDILADKYFYVRILENLAITGVATCVYVALMRKIRWLDPA